MKAGAKPVKIWVIPLVLLAGAFGLIATDLGGFATRIRGVEFDTYQHVRPRIYEDTAAKGGFAVRVLDIDEASVAHFGAWPWSRTVLARLVNDLKAQGASIVVLAMPLDTPDPATPSLLAGLLPDNPQAASARTALAGIQAPDDTLAATLGGIKTVTGFTLGEAGTGLPALKAAIDAPDELFAHTHAFAKAVPALPRIEAASAGAGALNLKPDSDGKIRSMPLFFRLAGKPVPSLDAEVMRVASGKSELAFRSQESGALGLGNATLIGGVTAGTYDVPLRADGSLQIYYSGPHAERHVSAASLESGQSSAALKNAIVYIAPPDQIVGTPDGARDIAEVRAEAMENILLGTALKPVSSIYAELVFLAIVGIGLVVLFARASIVWAGAATLLAIAGAQIFTWFLFTNVHILLDSANPSWGLALAFLGGISARGYDVARARTRLRGSFADTLSPSTIDAIARTPDLLKLEGETRVVTCLSCGLRRYGALVQSFSDDPVGFTRLINTAMAPLIEDAVGHGGMIGRFDGESFTAYWNAPLDDSEHAIRACEAANRMTVTLAEVNEQLGHERRFDGTAFEAIEIGIGISTGAAVVGGFTALGHTTYTVNGDSTVFADRIRVLSAQYGPAVVVSEETRKTAQRGFAFLEVDFIAAGPKNDPVKLYAMLGNPLVRASPKFRALETFHDHIFQSIQTQQWEKARGLIDQCRKLSGASPKMYDLHAARIAYYETHPPGAEWDGAFRQIVK
ncbi:MAG: adenylate/guanylate cyclase domain-containing protein [Rhizomicrobium sp.]